ncbi:DNA replication complex GINS protein PSF3 [Octopus bimaculoides]|nr:DNA replication complex GINS protein PSF3 [Octopus bimaculoides]
MSSAEGGPASTSLKYFDIDDILASQEYIPSKIEMTLYRLGNFINFYFLCLYLPYRIGYREVMKADASVVNLHKLGPYFYDLGCKLRYFPFTEIDDVAKSLLDTFQVRFRKILDASQSSLNEDSSSLTSTLDSTEKFLFHTGLKSLNDFQSWETRRAEKLTSSEMVRIYRKRKREND